MCLCINYCNFNHNIKRILSHKQESPPVGNRKRCTDRGITCPSPTVPRERYSHPVPAGGGGTPIQFQLGGGFTPSRLGPRSREGWGPPLTLVGKDGRTPRVNRQTLASINITFPRTSYAEGNYYS